MGKTTLMKSLMGIAPAARGTITLDGTDVTSIKTHRRVAAGFGYVPQGRAIFSAMTVEENVETGLSSTGERQPPAAIYELFPVLVEMRGRRGGNLSGGQQQQLAVARALASKPKVLLLDEPTEGLQPSIIKEMAQALCRIRDEWGLTIVVSEQVLSFAVDVADRVLVMENGNFVHESAREGIDEAKISKFLSV
jgi:urea transport system ATP-binding protein